MLTLVKLALRISTTTIDNELNHNIKECIENLHHCGISTTSLSSPNEAIEGLIVTYCKWKQNYEGEGERYHLAYIETRDGLCMDSDYNGWSECDG